MIDFKPIEAGDKPLYESYLHSSLRRGCEFSFLNIFLWGQQSYALLNGCLVLLSRFNNTYYYSYPLGQGDVEKTVEDIIVDSKKREIVCRINGIMPQEKILLESKFPDRFTFTTTPDSYDYVYDINDLAELSGKKYHGKRNHINRFCQSYPDYDVEHICDKNIAFVREMADKWFNEREARVPLHTFDMERAALTRLFDNFSALDAEGLILKYKNEILAFTVGSAFYKDIFDVHFEKASHDTDGAYTVINREFARYIRNKFPEVRFLDREEDMGLEGLRRAKQSYRPVSQIEKWRAKLKDE